MRTDRLKRGLALLLVAGMLVLNMDIYGCGTVKAAGESSYGTQMKSGNAGSNCKYTTYDTDGDEKADLLVISGTGPMSNGEYPLRPYLEGIRKVVIEYGVTRIGDWNFGTSSSSLTRNKSITSVEIQTDAQGSTTVESIGQYAFYLANNLQTINLPTGIKKIEGNALAGTPSLRSISLPEGLQTLGNNAVNGGSKDGNKDSVIIPSTVTSIGSNAVGGFNKVYSLCSAGAGEGNAAYTLTLDENGTKSNRYVLPAEAAKGTAYEGTQFDASVGFPFTEEELTKKWTKDSDFETVYSGEHKAVISGDTTFQCSDYIRRKVTFDLEHTTTDGTDEAKGGMFGEDYICTLAPEKKYLLDKESIKVKIGETELTEGQYSVTSRTDETTGANICTLTIPNAQLTADVTITAASLADESEYKVSLSADGQTVCYFSLTDAVAAWNQSDKETAVMTLLVDCMETELTIGASDKNGTVTLDLAGHTLKSDSLIIRDNTCTVKSSQAGGTLDVTVYVENGNASFQTGVTVRNVVIGNRADSVISVEGADISNLRVTNGSRCRIVSGIVRNLKIMQDAAESVFAGGTIYNLFCESNKRSVILPDGYAVRNPKNKERYTMEQLDADDFNQHIEAYSCTEHVYQAGYCIYCRKLTDCVHAQMDTASGICGDCGIHMLALVQIPDEDAVPVYCLTWDELCRCAETMSDGIKYVVQFYRDEAIGSNENILKLTHGNVQIKLGGYTLAMESNMRDNYMVQISGADVTIDNGKLVGIDKSNVLRMETGALKLGKNLEISFNGKRAYGDCIQIGGGELTVDGTTVSDSFLFVDGGTVTILEGSFTGVHCDTGILQIKGGTYNSTTNETHLTTNSINVSRSGHTLNGLLQDGYAFRKLKEDGTSGDWITDEEVLNGTTFAYGVRAEKKPDAPSVVPSETMEVAHSVKAVRDVSLPEAWEWSTESKDIALSAGVAAEAVAIYNGTDKEIYPEETCRVTVHITNSAHTDADGDGRCDISDCGAIIDGIGAKLAGYSLSLTGNIGVNFYMELSDDIVNDASAYMNFTLPNGTTSKVYVSGTHEDGSTATTDTTVKNGVTYYVFTCEVAAKEMTSDIKAQMIGNNGEKTGTVYTYTVKEYADYILSHMSAEESDISKATIQLVKGMLNYGGAAQKYFGYKTDKLASDGLTLTEPVFDDTSIVNFIKYETNKASIINYSDSDKVTFKSAYLSLNSTTDLCVNVKFAEDVTVQEDMFAIWLDSKEISKDQYEITKVNESERNCYKITLHGIKASQLQKQYEFEVNLSDLETVTLRYGATSYAYTVMSSACDNINNIESLREVVKALYAYGSCAQGYEYYTK